MLSPEVKSWMHALALGGFNYITQLAGSALGGAGVGAMGFLSAGIVGGSLGFADPTWASVWGNISGGFTGIWGASRALFGLNSLANEHAYGNVETLGDAAWKVVDGGVPEIGMAKRIFTGQAQPTDYMIFFFLLNIKAKGSKPAVEEPKGTGDKDGQPAGDKDGNASKKEEGQSQSKGQGKSDSKLKKKGKGDAYEDYIDEKVLQSPNTDFGKLKMAYEYYKSLGWPKGRIKSHLDGIDFTKPVELVEISSGNNFSHFQAPGGNKGNYFAKPNAKATELGINPKAQMPDGSIVDKSKTIYRTTENQTVLKSTAKSGINDTWSVPNEPPFPTSGGGTQYFTKDNSIFIQK